MVEKLTFNSLATALMSRSAVKLVNYKLAENLTSVALCCITKLHILECSILSIFFINCPQHKAHLCNDHSV
jgi:hypothetical protein